MNYYVPREKLIAIADSIRSKTSKSDLMGIDDMPTEIESISGGRGDSIIYTKKVFFDKSGLSTTDWTAIDGVTKLTKVRGDFVTNDDGLVCNGSNYFYPVDKSSNAFHIRCAINTDYVPVQRDTGAWSDGYSCIFGYDLQFAQKDFGIVISKDGYLGFGVASDAPVFSNKYIIDGKQHDIDFVNGEDNSFFLFLDGELILQLEKQITGSEIDKIHIFYTGYGNYGLVKGVISEIGYYTISFNKVHCPDYPV